MAINTKNKRNKVKKDIKRRMTELGNTGDMYDDMLEEYLCFWDIKMRLIDDISTRGEVVEYNNGGGQSGKKSNDSMSYLVKVSERMSKLLGQMLEQKKKRTEDDDDEL